jgi:formylglycine-generating enzyme required for sulfatase activity
MTPLRPLALGLLLVIGICSAPSFGAGKTSARAADGFPVPVGRSFSDCPYCPRMVVLPAGHFLMGSPPSEKYRFDNEGPQHPVMVPRAFAMAAYPITQEQLAVWRKTQVPPGEARNPAVMVTWYDAMAYARWLSVRTGHRYRLPTEAQYEYAERAGTRTPYYWGDTIGNGNANCVGCGSPLDGTGSTPVGSFPPNRWGLYDMAGDVFEWAADCYYESYAGAPATADVARASVQGKCRMRVLRASSWFNLPSFLRSAYRFRELPASKNTRRGFRVVRLADLRR